MIPVSEPSLGPLERSYLLDAFDSGWISSRGAYIERAESLLRESTRSPYALVCNNGTTALHLALLAAGIGPGDEVIVPALTYVATINAVYYVGATPVIVDVDGSTWCIDPDAVLRAVTARTAAILSVDLYGQTADYRRLRAVADAHGLALIADAAESFGASLFGALSGTLADITTFSFFGNKVITSGEGGAVTTADPTAHEKMLQLRNQGNHPTLRYQHTMVGYNYRMTNLSAALLTAQLERSAELLSLRQSVVDRYTAAFRDRPRVQLQAVLPGATPSPWMFSLRLTGLGEGGRDSIIASLLERGVESRPLFHLLQDMPFVPEQQRVDTPVAARISSEGISLPTSPNLTKAQTDFVIQSLDALLNEHEHQRPQS